MLYITAIPCDFCPSPLALFASPNLGLNHAAHGMNVSPLLVSEEGDRQRTSETFGAVTGKKHGMEGRGPRTEGGAYMHIPSGTAAAERQTGSEQTTKTTTTTTTTMTPTATTTAQRRDNAGPFYYARIDVPHYPIAMHFKIIPNRPSRFDAVLPLVQFSVRPPPQRVELFYFPSSLHLAVAASIFYSFFRPPRRSCNQSYHPRPRPS